MSKSSLKVVLSQVPSKLNSKDYNWWLFNGNGTHLPLFFVTMHGEFDNILQWPFTHCKVTLKLLNQVGGRDIQSIHSNQTK